MAYEWGTLLANKSQKRTPEKPPISVIIAAKNEALNLPNLMECLMAQDYPNYEIIIINDRSTDDSKSILDAYNHPNLRLLHIESSNDQLSGKKQALTQGISLATHEILLFTDADCQPPVSWISEMVSFLTAEKDLVIGTSPYIKHPSFLNRFIQLETTWTAQQMVGWGLLGAPYMGLGRNIMYRKTLFMVNRGFESHLSITSGDDDLFVQETANDKNTAYCLSEAGQVNTAPETKLKDYLKQKLRHLSTGGRYKFGHKLLLGAHAALGFIFYFSLLCLFLWNWKIALLFLIMRFLTKQVNLQSACRKFSLAKPAKSAFLFDLCYFLYLSTLGAIAPFIKRWQWR